MDLGSQLKFPIDIVDTSLRPDLLLLSRKRKYLIIGELTVPWEDNMNEAFEFKSNKYSDLVQSCRDAGWRTWFFPFEVGCRGFVSKSWSQFCHALGLQGYRSGKIDVSCSALKASAWIWRKHRSLMQASSHMPLSGGGVQSAAGPPPP